MVPGTIEKPWHRRSGGYHLGPHNHSRSMVFWRLHGHASMGGAESMSERRPGVPRLRHGAGVGVGHVCAEGTVHGPIVSRSHSGPKNLAKKNSETMVHCRLGIPERRVTGVDARARVRGGRAATTRSRVFLLMHTWVAARCFSSSSPPQTTAAVLGAAARGEPTDNGHAGHASHTRLCASHRACAAAAIGNDHPLCTMDAEKQEPQPEPLEACVPPV